jgi:hypothetical protein
MEDNIKECKNRLAGGNPSKEIIEILNRNIICYNSLEWDFFNWQPLYPPVSNVKLF